MADGENTRSGPECRIAIVDDDQGFRDSLVVLLDVAGFMCCAFDSVEALLDALDESIQAAVLDAQMPGVNGSDAVRRLRRVAPTLHIISMSGHAGSGAADALLAAGARAHLEKPFLLDALVRHLPR